MVLSKGKVRRLPVFKYEGDQIDIVYEFPYLGINLNYNAKLKIAQKELVCKATKAMYSVITKGRKLMLPIDIQMNLFNNLVKPILMYGAEVWGGQYINVADKLEVKFLKLIMGLHKSTPTVMVRGETGCYPVSIEITVRALCYWFKIVQNENQQKITKIIYNTMLSLYYSEIYLHQWLRFISDTLNKLGLTFVFENQANGISFNWFKETVKIKLTDQYKQEWHDLMFNNPLCINYRLFKCNFNFENFLISLPRNLSMPVLKFRTRNLFIPCLSLFPTNSDNDKKCKLCDKELKCDEFHLLLECNKLKLYRSFIPRKYCKVNVNNVYNLLNDPTYERDMAMLIKTIIYKLKK